VAEKRVWGLLNNLPVAPWAAVVTSVVLLDLTIYLQHLMFHAVPALWRVHRMHHADLDFDVTTGVRFHPIEIALSTLIKFAVVAALGAPALCVLIFEVLLNATSIFNHGNVRIPIRVDRYLRWLVVTPDMHRVHHSIVVGETNSNFGFNSRGGTACSEPTAISQRLATTVSRSASSSSAKGVSYCLTGCSCNPFAVLLVHTQSPGGGAA
jgi:sterol desaturase/sphingolipid hydroxylase (fatty acid hydroxylase superfamily)